MIRHRIAPLVPTCSSPSSPVRPILHTGGCSFSFSGQYHRHSTPAVTPAAVRRPHDGDGADAWGLRHGRPRVASNVPIRPGTGRPSSSSSRAHPTPASSAPDDQPSPSHATTSTTSRSHARRPAGVGARRSPPQRRLPSAAATSGAAALPSASSGDHGDDPSSSSSSSSQQSHQVDQGGSGAGLMLNEPLSLLDVDRDLWEALDMCSDEDLEQLYEVLHSASPFSPVLKSLVTEREPPLLQQRGRLSVMHKVETRFRFLAADPATLLRGHRPSYRDALMDIRDKLDVRCSSNLCTHDLEVEVFLHILTHCAEYVQGDSDRDPLQAAAVTMMAEEDGDGMANSAAAAAAAAARRPVSWHERLLGPVRLGLKEIVPTVVKLGSVVTVTAVGQQTTQRLAANLVCSHLRYQAAAKAATGMAREALSSWTKQSMLEAAQRGLTAATARYSAVQGALSLLGPLMWGALAVDLTLKAMGTDYGRIVRAVFLLAQVRLVQTQGFVTPDAYEARGARDAYSSDTPPSSA